MLTAEMDTLVAANGHAAAIDIPLLFSLIGQLPTQEPVSMGFRGDVLTTVRHNPRTLAATSDPGTHDTTAATPAGGP